jgi:hypothetical protein
VTRRKIPTESDEEADGSEESRVLHVGNRDRGEKSVMSLKGVVDRREMRLVGDTILREL